jgi:hypothetical protein
MQFIDVGGILLDGKKRFSWSCVQTADEAAQIIKASQSVSTVSRLYCVRHV